MPARTINIQNLAQKLEQPKTEVFPNGPVQPLQCISSVDYENKSAVVKNIRDYDLLF